MTSAIGDAAVKFVTKIFWPWFLKHVWPLIATALIGLLDKCIRDFAQRAEAAAQSSYEARTAKAQQSASEAERLAAEAVTDAERQRRRRLRKCGAQLLSSFLPTTSNYDSSSPRSRPASTTPRRLNCSPSHLCFTTMALRFAFPLVAPALHFLRCPAAVAAAQRSNPSIDGAGP